MSSDKRVFKDFLNLDNFNFKLIDGIIIFPVLYNKNKFNRTRIWEINIILFDNNDNKVMITNDLIKSFNKLNYYTKIISKTGLIDGKITISAPTIIKKGKNIGKINETNIITQSLIQARSLFLKKNKDGYKLSISDIDDKKNEIFYPIAIHKYEDYKHKLNYPLFIQPKLDGVRLLSFFKNDNINLVSRKLNNILQFNEIKKELNEIFSIYPNLVFDGELYFHGMNLQTISGIVRREDDTDKKKLKYYIFDCIDLENKDLGFVKRYEILNEIFSKFQFQFLVLTDTILVKNELESDKLYKKFINENYEGIIYKSYNEIYKLDYCKEFRSNKYLKRKKTYDDEFEIVNFTTGEKGKDLGSIIFIVKTKNGKEFNVVPNMTYKEKYKMYNTALKDFKNSYLGKMVTVKFDDYSKDGIPLRAKMITFRNYE